MSRPFTNTDDDSDSDGTVYEILPKQPHLTDEIWRELALTSVQRHVWRKHLDPYRYTFEAYSELLSAEARREPTNRLIDGLKENLEVQLEVYANGDLAGLTAFRLWLNEDLVPYMAAIEDSDGNKFLPFVIPLYMMNSETFWMTLKMALALLPGLFQPMLGDSRHLRNTVLVSSEDRAEFATLAAQMAEPFTAAESKPAGKPGPSQQQQHWAMESQIGVDFYTFLYNLQDYTDVLDRMVIPHHWMNKVEEARDAIHRAHGKPPQWQKISSVEAMTADAQNTDQAIHHHIQRWNEWIMITQTIETLTTLTRQLHNYVQISIRAANYVLPEYTTIDNNFNQSIIMMYRDPVQFDTYIDEHKKWHNRAYPAEFKPRTVQVPVLKDITAQAYGHDLLYLVRVTPPGEWPENGVREHLYDDLKS